LLVCCRLPLQPIVPYALDFLHRRLSCPASLLDLVRFPGLTRRLAFTGRYLVSPSQSLYCLPIGGCIDTSYSGLELSRCLSLMPRPLRLPWFFAVSSRMCYLSALLCCGRRETGFHLRCRHLCFSCYDYIPRAVLPSGSWSDPRACRAMICPVGLAYPYSDSPWLYLALGCCLRAAVSGMPRAALPAE